MTNIDPLTTGASPAPIRVTGKASADPGASRAPGTFDGLLENALRRLRALDDDLATPSTAGSDGNVEKLQRDLRDADQTMQSAAEIREMILRAYRGQ